jgi:hypothetical protein
MLKTNDIIRARVVEHRQNALLLASGEHRFYTSPPTSMRNDKRWREMIRIGDEFDVLVAFLSIKGQFYFGIILDPDDYDDPTVIPPAFSRPIDA